jgi:D-glycero-D-manno-heptose 1,7-bisphosphate phosphatase
VFLNGDESVRLYKGLGKPYLPAKDRALVLAGLSSVDYIVIFGGLNVLPELALLKPDVYVNGSDWGEHCIERPIVESYGGRLHVVKRGAVSTASTSDIIRNVCNDCATEPVKAVFIDRDGVILEDIGYLHEVSKAVFMPNAVLGLKAMDALGYKLIVVTNQSGIGEGKFSEAEMHAVNEWMLSELAQQGVRLTAVYVCPHGRDDGCSCRKPKTELLVRAANEYGVVLGKSWFVGDKWSDVECGRHANARVVLIKGERYEYKSKLQPDFLATDLLEAADIIRKG